MHAVPETTSRPIALRDGQRAFTRARICQGARDVFYRRSYIAATIEEIAHAAGTRRSTLYTHFRDKEEILATIAQEWVSGVCELVDHLQGPEPTRAEIDAWIGEVAAFVARERTPTVLLVELGNSIDSPPALQQVGAQLLHALAARLPAFRRAIEPSELQGLALARASVVLREIGWAALNNARDQGVGLGRELLVVAGELFERFVHDEK